MKNDNTKEDLEYRMDTNDTIDTAQVPTYITAGQSVPRPVVATTSQTKITTDHTEPSTTTKTKK